jgi:hydroxyacylglutathione hydrolase
LELKSEGVQVAGPLNEKQKIPGIDISVRDGDQVHIGSLSAVVLEVGGHTLGHIAYYFPQQKIVFVGDSLFMMGCGRMFEGTPQQFWASLQKLRDLPDDTMVYCAHEYTLANAKFAISVEPGNHMLMNRYAQVRELRNQGKSTVPSVLGLEKATNPFLRCDFSDEIRSNIGVGESDGGDVAFGKLRKAKDLFRG